MADEAPETEVVDTEVVAPEGEDEAAAEVEIEMSVLDALKEVRSCVWVWMWVWVCTPSNRLNRIVSNVLHYCRSLYLISIPISPLTLYIL
jgi:hypothetical protein